MESAVVLNNYELLERLLLHLPLRDLLLAKRIKRACADVIERSEAIRRALFLLPTSNDNQDMKIINPFMIM